MEQFIRQVGGNFIFMNITNYKTIGRKAFFHTPNFRELVKAAEDSSVNKVDVTKEWVAIDFPNHFTMDFDWRNDHEPDEEQLEWFKKFEKDYPFYPSATKERWGRHFLVESKKFLNLPTRGNPRLIRLCTNRNVVEVLRDTPAIVSKKTFLNYKIDGNKPSPQIDYYSFTQIRGKPATSLKFTKRVISADKQTNKPHAELRTYLPLLGEKRYNEYEFWFPVACVCRGLGDKDAWFEWSKKSPKYDEGSANKLWDSLRDDSSYTLATVIDYAKQDSPEDYKKIYCTYQRAKDTLEKEGIAINRSTAKLIRNGVEISYADAKSFLAPILYYDKKKDEMKQVFGKWICDCTRLTYDSVVFEPYNPKQGDQSKPNVYNSFRGMNFKYVEGTTGDDLHFLKRLIEANCCDPNLRTWILDYFCQMVQDPQENPKTSIVLLGHSGGTGKGTLVELMQSLLGGNLVHSTSELSQYFGNFNSSLHGKLFCCCEEVSNADGAKFKESIKNCITEPYHCINMKQKQPFQEKNNTRMIFCSNNKNPVLLDRRFVNAQTNPSHIISKREFDDFHTIHKYDKDWLNRLGSAMLDHKITSTLSVAPKASTDTLRLEGEIQPVHMLLRQLHDQKIRLVDDKYIKSSDLRYHHAEICEKMGMNAKYKQRHLYHMKVWLYQEYAPAFSRKKHRIDGCNTWWVEVNLPLVVEYMRLNYRYPSDDLYYEYFGDEEES